MKKIIALLATAVMLFTSAALADDVSGLSDDELRGLLENVYEEMTRRGMDFYEEVTQVQYGTMEEQEGVVDRLMEFHYQWCANRTDGMLALCDPAWKAQQEDPAAALAALLGDVTPTGSLEITLLGREEKNKWKTSISSEADRHDGEEPVRVTWYPEMVRADDGQWYVDPRSLEGYEILAETAAEDSMLLFYVPEGGEKYHLDQNCLAVADRYKPMQGMLTYSQLDEEAFKDLQPCSVCGAPERGLAGENLEKAASAPAEMDLSDEDREGATNRTFEFFSHWKRNLPDEMLEMCTSDWKAQQEDLRAALFALMRNMTPVESPELEMTYVYGTGKECALVATATMDRNDGREPKRFRYCLILKKEEDGKWHIDPAGLDTFEEAGTPAAQEEPAEDAGDAGDKAVMEPLLAFFAYWSQNRQDDMLELCSSDWKASVENPKAELFAILANRTPLDMTPETVSGTDGTAECTAVVTSTIDRNNGKEALKYRLEILMKQEADGSWRVDPRSLAAFEKTEQ